MPYISNSQVDNTIYIMMETRDGEAVWVLKAGFTLNNHAFTVT